MTWVAVAIGGAAVIGAGASYAGASKQAKASQQAGQLNMDMFNTLNRQQQPFIGSGYGAMGRLNTLLGINPNPNYRSMGSQMPPQGVPQGMPQGMPGGGSPFSRMYGQMRARQLAQQGGGGNAYMPTPGGGVQPIMQNGAPNVFAGGPSGDPYMNRTARLNQILSLRAANGDNQAADMMRSLGLA